MQKFSKYVNYRENQSSQEYYDTMNDDAELEQISNNLKRELAKIYSIMERSAVSKPKAINLLTDFVRTITEKTGLSKQNVKQAVNNALASGNMQPYPVPTPPPNQQPQTGSPPLQPMAQ